MNRGPSGLIGTGGDVERSEREYEWDTRGSGAVPELPVVRCVDDGPTQVLTVDGWRELEREGAT